MSLSNITLSAAVRQNLLSLQGTADLLATTQGRLATGKKVNSALDNPTNFFTAAGLDARASDISNLLDSIGNGVQVLQAANTGITSLSKLVDTAKSIANQVLQQPSGYTSRANVSIAAPTGAGALGVPGTATDLTNAGTNSLQGKTLVFKTASGTTTLTIDNTAGAGKVNSIDSINTALAAAGVELQATFNSNGSVQFTSTNNVLSALNTASITLRSQASAFGANLSIVQIRQDFNKNLINVLQTGSSALTLADTNEEAANSQALSTRQSIAVSALSLANQSQQSVLQLLR